jgi:AcrR family transcriptional regulator
MLRAAQSLFAEKGYARATLDEIADRAEFGKGTLYNYFEGGKEGILFAVFDEIYDDIYELIQDAFTGEAAQARPLRENFRAFVLESFSLFLEREDLFMVLIKESNRLCFSENAEHAAYFQQQQERMVNALTAPLEAAMERGEIQSLPPSAVAHMILENINGMLVHRAMTDRHNQGCSDTILQNPDRAADFLTTMLFDGLTRPTSDADPAPLASPHDAQ